MTETKKNNSSRPRPAILIGAALVLAVLAAMNLFNRTNQAGASAASTEQLQITPLLKASDCKAADPSARESHARKLERMAKARQERSVFVTSDGPRAALLLSEAEQCFQQSQLIADAARVRAVWEDWTQELSTRFGGHRLRLRLALKAKQAVRALDEITSLQGLLAGVQVQTDSPLAQFAQRLEIEKRRLRAASEKKKGK